MEPLATTIESVTVYPDRARVTRRGTALLGPGLHELELPDLPLELLPDSCRVAARSFAGVRLLGTEVRAVRHVEPPREELARATAEVEQLREEQAALAAREQSIGTRRDFLTSFATNAGIQLARGLSQATVGLDAGRQAAGFLSEQLAALDEDARATARGQREVGKRLRVAEERAAALAAERGRKTHSALVTLEVAEDAPAAAEVEVNLGYQVPHAGWKPVYDLRLTEQDGAPRLEVSYQASITQRTGESWEGVSLSVSTARPAQAATPPELEPWFVDVERYEPAFSASAAEGMPRVGAARAGRAQLQTTMAPAAMAQEATREAEHALPEVEESTAAVSFHLPGRTGVPGDGSPRKVTLLRHELPARLDYVTAPRLVSQAYRRVLATNATEVVLLAGGAQIFHEGEYLGTAPLKQTAPGQELQVYLGVDDRIAVERKLTEASVDKKFMMDVRRYNYAYEITVQNLQTTPHRVTVWDQRPVPRHESIKIRATETKPSPAEETDLGRLRWDLALAPGEKKGVRFGFAIEVPREQQLVGLPPLRDEAR